MRREQAKRDNARKREWYRRGFSTAFVSYGGQGRFCFRREGPGAFINGLHQHIKYMIHFMRILTNYTRLGMNIVLHPNGYVKGVIMKLDVSVDYLLGRTDDRK